MPFYEFLTTNDLLSQNQSGFRSNHSCETALNIIPNQWLHSMYENEYSCVLFVDLCKAFDLVDREILFRKLENYHTSENSLKWF